MTDPAPIGVCLVGPGNVGGETLTMIAAARSRWTLRSVVVRPRSSRKLAAGLPVRHDGERAVSAPDVDVVIDTNSDTAHGFTLLRAALLAGKAAVTANKDLAVRFGEHLTHLATEHGTRFGYDAAVCAALPVTALLRQHCALDEITEIDGLFSGTCNYILSTMATAALTLHEATASAQRLGYAEPEPSDDLNGLDAARKTALVARLATGRDLPLTAVTRVGIAHITPDDHDNAARDGQVLRLVSRIRITDETARAWVSPILIDNSHPFARATGTDNMIRIRTQALGTITSSAPGAGVRATAGAILNDAHHQVMLRNRI